MNHLLRIDARGLGLFRIALGVTLIGDLAGRFRYARDFYSNEGVLPNHNHLFNLKTAGRFVWSALHSFSTPGEAEFALALIGLAYALFTLGVLTRAMSVVSFVGLLSLVARNTLAEGPGDWLALAMLGFGAMLPLGSRYSVDALVDTLRRARAEGGAGIGDRSRLPTEAEIAAHRLPGHSLRSFAALGLHVQLALVLVSFAAQHRGAWLDGTALGKALAIDLFASPLGASLRQSALLVPLTWLVTLSSWAVPALLVVPIVASVPGLRGGLRLVAAVLLAGTGLVFGLLTNEPLFGFTLLASAPLCIAAPTWRAWASTARQGRSLVVVYDDDCGVCAFTAASLERLDSRGELSFVGRSVLGVASAGGSEAESPLPESAAAESAVAENAVAENVAAERTVAERAALGSAALELPASVTAELCERTVVVVRRDGSIVTRAEAVSAVLRALPGLGWLGLLLRAPGVAQLAGVFYDGFAARRHLVSAELGLGACGVRIGGPAPLPRLGEAAPAVRLGRALSGSVRELAAGLFLLSIVAQTSQQNALGTKLPQPGALESIAWWTRTRAAWNFLAPEPASEQGRMVTDALTRDERSIDVLTGAEPTDVFGGAFALGPMWARYGRAIALDENKPFHAAFRTYLNKRGPAWAGEATDDRLSGVDAYWAVGPAQPGAKATMTRLFRQGRGGKRFDAPGQALPATRTTNALQTAKGGARTPRTLRPLVGKEGEALEVDPTSAPAAEQAPASEGAAPRADAVGPQPDGAPPPQDER